MTKKIIRISFLPIIAAMIFLSSTKKVAIPKEFSTEDSSFFYTVPQASKLLALNSEEALPVSPILKKNYIGFKEAVGFKESGGRYRIVNEFGYLGKYQFGKGTLELLGIYNLENFLNSPQMQEAAFYANASRNKWILRRDIKRFEGKTINGIKITESGILAAAHLAGPGSVKKYLRSWGANSFSDAFGTSVGFYLKKFSGYDTSFIKAEKNAKAKFPIVTDPSEL